MKLQSKERASGKIKRRYDTAKTPYQRVMESPDVSEGVRRELSRVYRSLNPAKLKREIDRKLTLLYQAKHPSQKVESQKKLHPSTVTFLIAQPEPVSVT